MDYESLPAAAQTAYADLLDSLISAPTPDRGVSYFTRPVKGRDYWYVQQVVGGRKRSFYLGPDDDATRELVAAAKRRQSEDRDDRPLRERLAATGIAAGLWTPGLAEARIYEALAQSGIFAAGGVLVGSHAFYNLGNSLGVRWTGAGRTDDVDVGRDTRFHVAAPDTEEDVFEALKARDPSFLPVPGLDPKEPSTRFKIRRQGLSVSLLTPERGRPGNGPVKLKALGAAAEPVRHLEYVLEESQVAAVPTGAGILVRLPDPARFAIHKLVVSQRRHSAAKTGKDRQQAEVILRLLAEIRPGSIAQAVDAARARPGRFMVQLQTAARVLGVLSREALESAGLEG